MSIVETQKEFRNILLGQQIKVCADHKNLTHKIFNTEWVMQWRLILEEYHHELICIQGSKNIATDTYTKVFKIIAVDALSRLDIVDTPNPVQKNIKCVNNHYGLEDKEISPPSNYKVIIQNQQKNKELIKISQTYKDYSKLNFHGADKKYSLICKNRKIGIPKQLENQIVEWYHDTSCHHGETHTELSIS